MIDTAQLVDALVYTFQSIPELVAAMNGNPGLIKAFHYLPGVNTSLEKTVFEMPGPSITCFWEGTQCGLFDAASQFKYHVGVYFRVSNQANAITPSSYERLWYVSMNAPVLNTTVNIRYTQILKDSNGSPLVDIMDSPEVEHLKDENHMDYFKGTLVFPDLSESAIFNGWTG